MEGIVDSVLNSVQAFIGGITTTTNTVKLAFSWLPSHYVGVLFAIFGFIFAVCIYKGIRG